MAIINESGGAFLWKALSFASSWVALTIYGLSTNAWVTPTTPNGYIYKTTVSGTSGASEPSWPTTIGNTVVDGTVTWECKKVGGTYIDLHDAASGTVSSSSLVEVGQLTWLTSSGERVRQIYRDALFFNTSGLSAPEWAKITGLVETRTNDADFDIVVINGSVVENTPVAADYGDLEPVETNLGSINIASVPAVGSRVEITLNASGLALINLSGTTKFALRSSRDISATDPKQNGGDYDEYIDLSDVRLETPSGFIPKAIFM